uniref:BACK domain-containing protein n=1 Tax=Panagrellus redivivus TaxID=6233 RepID=A0A7E4V361_PANRE
MLSLDDLADIAFEFLSRPWKNLNHENLEILSTDALNMVLTRGIQGGPNFSIFDAVVGWMKANPSKSADFPGVLKNFVFDIFTLEELKKADIVDANVLACQQQIEQRIPAYQTPDENVTLAKYGFKIITFGGKRGFKKSIDTLEHRIGSSAEGILIDLGRPFLLNSIKMLIRYNNSYWIDVSKDNINWTRVIDHSKYKCSLQQNLFFKERFVRLIRICYTAPVKTTFVKTTFVISQFEALYTTEPFKIHPKSTLIIPSNIITLVKNDLSMHGVCSFANNIRISRYTVNFSSGIIVQLPQPYLIDTVKLLLLDNGVYCYTIQVSVDKVKWTPVKSEQNVSSWRKIRFNRQPVVFINLPCLS